MFNSSQLPLMAQDGLDKGNLADLCSSRLSALNVVQVRPRSGPGSDLVCLPYL